MKSNRKLLALACLFFLPTAVPVKTQQITTNAPGSPNGTTTIDGRYLPNPPAEFGGVINFNITDSKPYWPPQIVPPKDAPNVLLILVDDCGFGGHSTFGGVIPTPACDRVAKMGLRYTAFHSTALCSPTRAALITGRNHHSVGTGVVVETATGFPGYNSIITKDCATIGETLKENGYATAWFGKEHNTPIWEASQNGPFDRWPVGMGFDYFYGFVGGDASQWQPNLFRNTTPIEPYLGKPGWNLITAMADDAIQWMKGVKEIEPNKPFFCYYCPGGTHAPHHPTKEWVDKIHNMHLFDDGWNKLRDTIYANQLKLGVIPANAKLTPWPESLKEWDTLSADEKKLFIRQAEVYAAYLAYTDYEIGRVIEAVEDMGQLDNTLIIYITGDNGASPEGSEHGTPNEVASLQGGDVPVKDQLKFYDVWGTDQTYPHYAVGWAWALDTPYRWTKEVASHFGGTRQGTCMAWPKRIKDAGGIRWQFSHVIDIVPTILEACGIPQPVMVNGIAQKPIEGVSMVYTWDKENADVPSRHHTQYFEMFGTRALYHDGWIASAPPQNPPWLKGKEARKETLDVMNGYKWELYDLNADWTQFTDLADKMPDKLRELKDLFTKEATLYNVFPLDNQEVPRLLTPRPGPAAPPRSVFTYRGELGNLSWGVAPSLLGRSYTITAEVEIPERGAEGMLVTQGGRFGGYGFYLLKGKPVFLWNLLDLERVRWEDTETLEPGRHTLVFDFKYDGPGIGKGGLGVLTVDGKEVARQNMEHTIPFTLQWDEAFNVGFDTGTPVDDSDYQVPFHFTGKINELTIKLDPTQFTLQDEKRVRVVEERADDDR